MRDQQHDTRTQALAISSPAATATAEAGAMRSLRPVIVLLALGWLRLTTIGMHPAAPHWRRVALRRAELERPTMLRRKLHYH